MRKKIFRPIKQFFSRVNRSFRKGLSKFVDLFYRTYVGIDITASEVRILTAKRNTVRKWSAVSLAKDVIKDGIILEPQTLGLVLDSLFNSMKLPRNHVVCDITGMPFVYRIINMPYTGDTIDKEAIERAARKEMSLSETDMYLFWQATETHSDLKERDYLVFGVPRHAVHHLVEALDKAGIKRYMLDVKPLALGRAASLKDAILVSLEKEYVDVAVIVGGIVRIMHGFAPTRIEDLPDGYNREVLNGLGSAVKSYDRYFSKIPLPVDVPIVLSGELAENIEITDFLKQNYEHPVYNIDLFSLTNTYTIKPRFTSALGLLWKTLVEKPTTIGVSDYKDINIDFFSRLKTPLAERFKPSYAVTTLVIIALLAVVYFSYDYYQEISAKVDSLDIEYATSILLLNQAQKENTTAITLKQEETANIQNLQKQLDTLESQQQYIAGLQHEYADEIISITNALPSQCQYTQITMYTYGYIVIGEADSLSDILSYAGSLEIYTEFLAVIKSVQPLETDRVQFELDISRK
jgi:Tfp pilus assembly protein PilN